MKSLYKKMAVGALSAALVVGAGASASHAELISEMIENGKKMGVNVRVNRLPFKPEIEVMYNSEQRARNNAEIVFGFRDMFDYHIWGINGSAKEEYINGRLSFDSAHDFIEHISKNGISEGRYVIKIEQQSFILDFRRNIKPGFGWLLYLDKHYQKGLDVYLKSIGAKLKY